MLPLFLRISITQNFITVCIQAIQLNVNVTFYRHSPETRSSSKLIVKMPNLNSKHKRSPTATKRINRAVSVANRKIAFLKKEKQEHLRKNWSLKKSVLRRAKAQSCQTTPHKSTEMSMLTPRRKSRQQLREAGLAPRTVPVLRKRLHNAMVEEVKLSKNTERRKKKSNLNPLTVVTGSIVKKYRLTNRLRSELGVSRQCAVPMQMKHLAVMKKNRLLESRNHLRQHITNFLEVDENSTCLPGKRDAQKVDDEKVQKRVLND